MPAEELYPGQVQVMYFDLAQVTAIASAPRSEVFWTYNPQEPLAVADVARMIGKSAATVNYHTNALHKVGLIIPVGERQRVARREKLYVHAARDVFSKPMPFEDEYRRQMDRGFSAMLRSISRDRAALHRAFSVVPDLGLFSHLNFVSYRLSPEDAYQLKLRLDAVLEEFGRLQTTDGIRINSAVTIIPSMGEIRAAYHRLTGAHLIPDSESGSETIPEE